MNCPALSEALVVTNDDALRRLAGVDEAAWKDEKRKHGPLCVALAKAARAKAGTDIGVASLGMAAGSQELAPDERESGKTCIAVDSVDGDAYWEFRFAGTDGINQTRATVLTIEMLRRYLTGYIDPDHPHSGGVER